jgi:hypothetical protein
MNKLSLILFFFCIWSCNRCQQENAVNELNATSPEPDSFEFSTPDSIAFNGVVLTGVNQSWWKYSGYAFAESDKTKWKFLPAFYHQNLGTDSVSGFIAMYEFNKNGFPIRSLKISGFPLKPGVYFPIKHGFPTRAYDLYINYQDLNDACSGLTYYDNDPAQQSFLKIISYNSATKEVRARFMFYLKLNREVSSEYPSRLIFDEGVVVAKCIN